MSEFLHTLIGVALFVGSVAMLLCAPYFEARLSKKE